jgi:hypothetical protein
MEKGRNDRVLLLFSPPVKVRKGSRKQFVGESEQRTAYSRYRLK